MAGNASEDASDPAVLLGGDHQQLMGGRTKCQELENPFRGQNNDDVEDEDDEEDSSSVASHHSNSNSSISASAAVAAGATDITTTTATKTMTTTSPPVHKVQVVTPVVEASSSTNTTSYQKTLFENARKAYSMLGFQLEPPGWRVEQVKDSTKDTTEESQQAQQPQQQKEQKDTEESSFQTAMETATAALEATKISEGTGQLKEEAEKKEGVPHAAVTPAKADPTTTTKMTEELMKAGAEHTATINGATNHHHQGKPFKEGTQKKDHLEQGFGAAAVATVTQDPTTKDNNEEVEASPAKAEISTVTPNKSQQEKHSMDASSRLEVVESKIEDTKEGLSEEASNVKSAKTTTVAKKADASSKPQQKETEAETMAKESDKTPSSANVSQPETAVATKDDATKAKKETETATTANVGLQPEQVSGSPNDSKLATSVVTKEEASKALNETETATKTTEGLQPEKVLISSTNDNLVADSDATALHPTPLVNLPTAAAASASTHISATYANAFPQSTYSKPTKLVEGKPSEDGKAAGLSATDLSAAAPTPPPKADTPPADTLGPTLGEAREVIVPSGSSLSFPERNPTKSETDSNRQNYASTSEGFPKIPAPETKPSDGGSDTANPPAAKESTPSPGSEPKEATDNVAPAVAKKSTPSPGSEPKEETTAAPQKSASSKLDGEIKPEKGLEESKVTTTGETQEAFPELQLDHSYLDASPLPDFEQNDHLDSLLLDETLDQLADGIMYDGVDAGLLGGLEAPESTGHQQAPQPKKASKFSKLLLKRQQSETKEKPKTGGDEGTTGVRSSKRRRKPPKTIGEENESDSETAMSEGHGVKQKKKRKMETKPDKMPNKKPKAVVQVQPAQTQHGNTTKMPSLSLPRAMTTRSEAAPVNPSQYEYEDPPPATILHSEIIVGPIVLNRHDAVFGRGRKKNDVRIGSVYRDLIEFHWFPYNDIPINSQKQRRSYVQEHIINGVLRKGGRFIMRRGDDLRQLLPQDSDDCRDIHKKIQRALFNEKKRQQSSKEKKRGTTKGNKAVSSVPETQETFSAEVEETIHGEEEADPLEALLVDTDIDPATGSMDDDDVASLGINFDD